MRTLVLKMSMSVDGFVAADQPDSDWMFHGTTPESGTWVYDTLAGAGVHALGRSTFESWITFWPTSDNRMAGPLNTIPKVVFARQPGFDLAALSADLPASDDPASWTNTRVARGSLADEVAALKQEDGDYILAQGGVTFCRSLVEAGLVDEYRFAFLPVALGSGAKLFTGPLDLDLVSSTAFPGGAIGNVYRPKASS